MIINSKHSFGLSKYVKEKNQLTAAIESDRVEEVDGVGEAQGRLSSSRRGMAEREIVDGEPHSIELVAIEDSIVE